MQEANQSSVYEIRSRNPIHEPKPFLDSAKNSIEYWEVFELETQLPIAKPALKPIQTKKRMFSNVHDLFEAARNRVRRF